MPADNLATMAAADDKNTITASYLIKPAKVQEPPEVFCCRFSPDDTNLACSYADGTIRVFEGPTGKELFALNKGTVTTGGGAGGSSPSDVPAALQQSANAGLIDEDMMKALKPANFPTTQVRWRPAGSESKTKNVLISVNAETDGCVQHWHVKSGKCLHTIKEEGNQIFCLDYYHNGALFATAGRDYKVRIYDEATKRLTKVLEGGDQLKTAGHSNRVFSVKFHSQNPNLLVSAGWDNTVQLWDLRKGQSIRSIYGAYICGDSCDLNHDSSVILTGSYRTSDTLQMWDFGSGKLIHTVKWRPDALANDLMQEKNMSSLGHSECMCFAAQFSKSPGSSRYILAGGSQNNEAKVFDTQNGTTDITCVGSVQTLKPVFSADFDNETKKFAIGGADGTVRVMNLPQYMWGK